MRGMGRVFKRGPVWWIAYSHQGREYRESSRSTKKADAEALRIARLSTLQQGLPAFGATQQHTMVQLLERAEAAYLRRGGRALKNWRSHCKPLKQYFGGRRVVDLRERDLEHYVEHRKARGRADSTINRELGILNTALQLALRDGIIARRPHLPRMPERTIRQGFWEATEVERHVQALPDWLRDVAWFAYYTGWRQGEILALEWRDIDLTAKTLLLRPEHTKTERGRLLPLEGPLWALIERRLAGRLPVPWVFHRDGKQLKGYAVWRYWQKAWEPAGTTGRLFHDFRRTAARNMVRAGVPERVVMEIVGHKTRSMLDRYNIVNLDDMRTALQRTYAYLETQPQTATVVKMERK